MTQTFISLGRSRAGPWLLAAVYFGLAIVSLAITGQDDGVATIWPPSGLLLAVLLIVPRSAIARFALAAAIASLAANLAMGAGIRMAAGFTIANVAEAMIATLLLRRRSLNRVSFLDLRGLPSFFTASLIAAAGSAATAGIAGPLDNWHLVMSWFVTVWLGMLLVTPMFMGVFELWASSRRLGSTPQARHLPWVFLVALIANCATFLQSQYPILFVPMIVIVLAVLRAGAPGAVVGVIVSAIVGSFAIWLDVGPVSFIDGPRDIHVLFFQTYLLALVASALPMAALLAGRDRLRTDLAERVRLLDQAEQTAHLGHWRVNPASQAIFWSPEVFRIHGLPQGRPPAMERAIEAYHPDDRSRVADIVERAMTDGQPFTFEARVVRPDGTIRHVLSRGERDYTSQDDAIGLFGLIQDVTEQVEARQILADARDAAERSARTALVLAETDPLTGLANRRRIVQHLTDALDAAEAGHGALSVVMFDIDHFKSVNDRFGHDIGDEVLKRVARCASEGLRSTDLLGRYGGEEFVLILPGAGSEVALQIAERVRATIEASHGEGNDAPPVTASLGVATAAGAETPATILKRADAALYVAKGEGRNRLRLAA